MKQFNFLYLYICISGYFAFCNAQIWPYRIFAPYVDVTGWPTPDIAAISRAQGIKHFTLAFIVAGKSNLPSWGGVIPLSDNFYATQINQLRANGGNVIMSFGGASGQELALVISKLDQLVAAYQSVIDMYQLTWLDFDIEGAALPNSASVDLRNQAILQLKAKNPGIKISYTLPVLPNGLTNDGVNLLKSAVKYGLSIDVINLMTMDYGTGAAPNGATGMGGYAISAAKAVLAQAQQAGLTAVYIGITPMIGVNDVQTEIFRPEDAAQVLEFASSSNFIGILSFWSIIRDTSKSGPLYASSQIKQADYEFSKIFVNFDSKIISGTSSSTIGPSSTASVPPLSTNAPPYRIFAPYVDVTGWPTPDIAAISRAQGIKHFTLAFIVAGKSNLPSWGGVIPLSDNFYATQINQLRANGGNVIMSFGGASGQELALVISKLDQLVAAYQSVIDMYQLTWLDFDIEGAALPNSASVDLRNQAILQLKAKNPGIKISYTLPVLPNGLTNDGVNLLKSAVKYGLSIDVINLMTMDYGTGAAPNGATGMGGYAISAAKAVLAQAQQAGLTAVYIGITPMIGVNDVQTEIFRPEDAAQVLEFASSSNFIGILSFWSIIRDTSKSGPLYASSQIKQADYEFSKIFVNFDSKLISGTSSSTIGPSPTASVPPLSTNAPPYRIFAPYVDVTGWPTPDIAAISQTSNITNFTLSYIVAGRANIPSWGGFIPVSDNFFASQINQVRSIGGNVIASLGGPQGVELALVITNLNQLVAAYQSIIDTYKFRWLDFDIEGLALSDTVSIDRRNQAIVQLKAKNPGLQISYTLPALPTGLNVDGVNLLKSAVKNGLSIDVINLLTMNYLSTAASNGATGMGGYAIIAANSALIQAQLSGMSSVYIGITPMIGVNDIKSQIFRPEDAAQVLEFASSSNFISMLSFWSIIRDTSVNGPLYASSQIQQSDHDFSKIFVKFQKTKPANSNSATLNPSPSPSIGILPSSSAVLLASSSISAIFTASLVPSITTSNSAPSQTMPATSNIQWPAQFFAPQLDVTAWPVIDVAMIKDTQGLNFFKLGYITSNAKLLPAWAGVFNMSRNYYSVSLSSLRASGGDAIVTFGGSVGFELATVISDVKQLVSAYQDVIDQYKFTRLDFDIEGKSLLNNPSIDLRNQAIKQLQQNNPGITISYSLPAGTTGLIVESLNVIKSAIKYGVLIDSINMLMLDYPDLTLKKPAGFYTTAAAANLIKQLKAINLSTKIGITPMIGVSSTNKVFNVSDAIIVANYAKSENSLSQLSFISLNRDNSLSNYQFCNVFKAFGQSASASNSVIASPPAQTITSSLALTTTFSSVRIISASSAQKTISSLPIPTSIPATGPKSWNNRIYAPYVQVWNDPANAISNALTFTATKHFVVAFIVDDGKGNPAFQGSIPMSNNFLMSPISKARSQGGDVIFSFGGQTGVEMARVIKSSSLLQQIYQKIIDQYSLTWIDFDLEGANLKPKSAVRSRSGVLASLQILNPSLRISFTLAANTYGLDKDSLYILESAKSAGVVVSVVNIMTMDYGTGVNGATGMGDAAILSAQNTQKQLQEIGLNSVIGITPMIGQNDVLSEIFRLEDAEKLVNFAKINSWIGFIGMWALQRDNDAKSSVLDISSNYAQSNYSFSNAFAKYEN